MIINRFNLKLSFRINYYTHDTGKFFWVGLKINNPTRIVDIPRNPSKIVGIVKALRKLWLLSNVHKACGVILSRLLYIHIKISLYPYTIPPMLCVKRIPAMQINMDK
mgnify:CR=1 FL=1